MPIFNYYFLPVEEPESLTVTPNSTISHVLEVSAVDPSQKKEVIKLACSEKYLYPQTLASKEFLEKVRKHKVLDPRILPAIQY